MCMIRVLLRLCVLSQLHAGCPAHFLHARHNPGAAVAAVMAESKCEYISAMKCMANVHWSLLCHVDVACQLKRLRGRNSWCQAVEAAPYES